MNSGYEMNAYPIPLSSLFFPNVSPTHPQEYQVFYYSSLSCRYC